MLAPKAELVCGHLQVILRGQALAGRMQRRRSEIQVLLEIGVKGNALGVLQEGLAKEEKEMEVHPLALPYAFHFCASVLVLTAGWYGAY